MAKKQQWRKKGKPWMPSITHQRAGSLIQSLPPSSRPNSPLLLDVSRPKMRCEINKERLPATENLLWMLHKKNPKKPFEDFRAASMTPIHHLFDSHEHCNPE